MLRNQRIIITSAADNKTEIKMRESKLSLWSFRFSPMIGNHAVHERYVTEETSQQWLEAFKKIEPDVLFLISDKKPKLVK